jgi:predicted KAP-like P-loop ATPase
MGLTILFNVQNYIIQYLSKNARLYKINKKCYFVIYFKIAFFED